jgi:transposase-like protein
MTTTSMNNDEALRKILSGDGFDFLKDALVRALTEVMEVEVARLTGAGLHERSDERQNSRNGYRERRFDTRLGSIELLIPKLRKGSYFPGFLEPRKRSERALLAVIQEAYVQGVSTRKVEDLLLTLGVENCSKSEVSRVCQALDDEVAAFRERPLEMAYPYLWLDATYLKVREDGRVVSRAVVVAYGVNEDGYREVLGLEVGLSESEAFWTEFLRSLVRRGLRGVEPVVSDDHRGLVAALTRTLEGASWQRCYVHFLRNVNAKVPKARAGMVIELLRTIFAQSDEATARAQLRFVADKLTAQEPEVARMLLDAEADLLAHYAFPEAHRKQLRSTNPLERLNKEIKRRGDVVGIFPNRPAIVRLIGAVLAEQHDEWQVGRRAFPGAIGQVKVIPETTMETLMQPQMLAA